MRSIAHRVDDLDVSGGRVFAVLQSQQTEIVKDLAEWRGEQRTWQVTHESRHDQERRDRVTGRRWLVGTGIAGLAALAGLYAMVEQILVHLH